MAVMFNKVTGLLGKWRATIANGTGCALPRWSPLPLSTQWCPPPGFISQLGRANHHILIFHWRLWAPVPSHTGTSLGKIIRPCCQVLPQAHDHRPQMGTSSCPEPSVLLFSGVTISYPLSIPTSHRLPALALSRWPCPKHH